MASINKLTVQEKAWGGGFGKKYSRRNPNSTAGMNKLYKINFGVTRQRLNAEFLGKLSRSLKILEVGANVGSQLALLQKMGFVNLYGVEINRDAIEYSKATTKYLNIIKASALNLPFKDGYFDLVFTSGVLIHISPKDIKPVISEMYRCSNKYLWGYEYFANKYTAIDYRGHKNLLWKANFPSLFKRMFKKLKLVKIKKLKYCNSNNIDVMYLFKKNWVKQKIKKI